MKSLPTSLRIAGIAALIGCAIASANAQNIVVDPGFEASSSFAPAWTLTEQQPPGPPDLSNVGTNPAFAHSGNNHANLADDTGQMGSLTQTLNTQIGKSYTLSFWLANDVQSTGFFNGSFGTTSLVFATAATTFGYTQFVVSNLVATTATTVLSFNFRQDDDFWRLDDVSVSVPDAGTTLWLALPALAGLCLINLRLNRRAVSRS